MANCKIYTPKSTNFATEQSVTQDYLTTTTQSRLKTRPPKPVQKSFLRKRSRDRRTHGVQPLLSREQVRACIWKSCPVLSGTTKCGCLAGSKGDDERPSDQRSIERQSSDASCSKLYCQYQIGKIVDGTYDQEARRVKLRLP